MTDLTIGLVFLDAVLPAPGISRLDQIAAEGGDPADLEKLRVHLDAGGRFPYWDEQVWARLVGDPVLREDVRSALVPHGVAYWQEVISCSDTYDHYAAIADQLGWDVVVGPEGHLAIVDRPDDTAAILRRWIATL